jgi:competence protein ComEA
MFKKMFLVLLFFITMTVAALAGVNINTADEATLVALPGIGPVKATSIIEYRKDNGSFSTIEDLKKVKGIGVKTLEKLRDQITVED